MRQTESFRELSNPIFWSKDVGALGVSSTAVSRLIDNPAASATSSLLGCFPFLLYSCFLASRTRYVASTIWNCNKLEEIRKKNQMRTGQNHMY